MRLIVALFAVLGILVAQDQPAGGTGFLGNVEPQKRVFRDADATVTIIATGQEGVLLPILHTGPNIEADTAIVDIFYRYESSSLKAEDGKPLKLLLSVRVTCLVLAGIDSACDNTLPRMGLSIEAIEFVRVKFLRTTREIDHIKPL